MNKLTMALIRWGIVMMFCFGTAVVQAQAFEIEQLALDIEKLSQLKKILQDLKDGYAVLDKGYSTIRDISQGSFNLHKAFLDGLLAVSPAVRNYKRVADIVSLEVSLVSKYKKAWARFARDPHLRPEELAMMAAVYGSLLDEGAKGLDDLATVLTDGVIRASDAERLSEIDGIYDGMTRRAASMDGITRSTEELSLGRAADERDYETVKQLYGMVP